ncbi:MAG TPA: metalloregulator ArsR/SmtB family transcription factor [Anaerolineae bacterium]|nr:metalloregulator ArsR/SmtB family transcription factor [Anaerolineae bacterium]
MIGNENTSLIYKHMPTTRRRILTLLKEENELTADELAELLGISAVAVRRHLTKLESDQLVEYKEMQRGMGRPSFVYYLGEAATSFFPRRYEELASSVLETIRELYGADAVDAVFRMRSEQFMSNYRRKINGKTLDTRLEQLTQLREADGYMSSWEQDQDNTFILREANCPIINVAAGCEAACSHDKAMLETLLDAQVIRKGHLAKGDGACVYEVRPKIEVEQ